MRSRSRTAAALIVGAAYVLLPALPASAAETESSELVIITESDVVSDDLYAVANRVIIRGHVDGDVVAIAAQDVRIEGVVTGSVTAIGASVAVTGSIGGSLRATAGSVAISGEVAKDVVVAVGSFSTTSGSVIGGDIVLWAWKAVVLGSVGGGLEGFQRRTELAGEILGDVEISAPHVSVTGDLHIGGDLGYRSKDVASGLDRAEVDGVVVQKEPTPLNIRLRALRLVARVLVVMMLTAVALLVAWGWPERTQRALDAFRNDPFRSFLKGGLLMFSPILLAGLSILLFSLAPTNAALPLMIVLGPLIAGTFGLVVLLALGAGIPMVAWLGNLVARKATIFGAIVAGSAVVGFIWLVPLVGWLVPLVFLTGGFGAWMGAFSSRGSVESG